MARKRRFVSTISPLAAAHKFCANWCSRECRGIGIHANITTPLPFCLVDSGFECVYFERYVLSSVMHRSGAESLCERYRKRTTGRLTDKLADVEDEELRNLLLKHPFVGDGLDDGWTDPGQRKRIRGPKTTGHQCECGATLPARRRLCDKCRDDRHRERMRRQMRARR